MRDRAHAARLTRMTALMTYCIGDVHHFRCIFLKSQKRATSTSNLGSGGPLASPCSLVAFSAGWIRPRHHCRNARVCSGSQEKRRYRRYTPAPRRCPQGRNWAFIAGRRAIAPAMGRQACACSMQIRPEILWVHGCYSRPSASSGHVGLGMLGTRAAHELRRSRAPAFPPPVQPCGRAIRPHSR